MRFPNFPPRGLALRTPPMQGNDVLWTQQAMNIWAQDHPAYLLPVVRPDGQWGPVSDHTFAAVAYSMGLRYYRPMRANVRLVWHPWMRSPLDLAREKQRAKSQPDAPHKALNWEQALAQAHFSAPNDRNPILQGWEVDEGVSAQPGEPWCQYFQNEAWHLATARKLPSWFLAGEPGYTPWVLEQARRGVGGLRTCPPTPGCWIFFSWGMNGSPDHVGMVVDVGKRMTVEGNTSSSYGQHTVAIHQGTEHWPYACGFVWPWDMK